MNYLPLIGSFGIGLVASFVGAIAGGGGMISVPFLLFLGVPPQVALATSKFAGLGLSSGAMVKFVKEKKVNWRYAIILSVAGIIASLIGSRFLVSSGHLNFEKVIGVMLLILVPTLFIKKDFGLIKIQVSPIMKVVGTLIYFLLSILASMFGGLGVLMISTVVFFFGLSLIEANATDIVSYAALSIVAVAVYIIHGIVNFPLGIAMFLGSLFGGYAGAHTAITRGNKFVKVIFAIVIVAAAIKILLK